jgi:hypothetical protein
MPVIIWWMLWAAGQLVPPAEPRMVWVCAGSSDALRSQAGLHEAIERGQCTRMEVQP